MHVTPGHILALYGSAIALQEAPVLWCVSVSLSPPLHLPSSLPFLPSSLHVTANSGHWGDDYYFSCKSDWAFSFSLGLWKQLCHKPQLKDLKKKRWETTPAPKEIAPSSLANVLLPTEHTFWCPLVLLGPVTVLSELKVIVFTLAHSVTFWGFTYTHLVV